MASEIIKVTENVRSVDQSYFSGHSGSVKMMRRQAEDGSLDEWHIWAAAPTASNFNDAPVGSYLYDTDAPDTVKRQTSAGTWQTLTFS